MSERDAPTVLSRIVRLLRQASAPSEGTYDRDGAFSHHAETHAAGVGLGVGIAASMMGEYRYAGAILALVFGLNRGPQLSSAKIVEDLRQESHYAIGGLGLGLLLGAIV